jgi:hypothetical protein
MPCKFTIPAVTVLLVLMFMIVAVDDASIQYECERSTVHQEVSSVIGVPIRMQCQAIETQRIIVCVERARVCVEFPPTFTDFVRKRKLG